MMLVKFKGNINFMKYRKIALALSLALVLASIVSVSYTHLSPRFGCYAIYAEADDRLV